MAEADSPVNDVDAPEQVAQFPAFDEDHEPQHHDPLGDTAAAGAQDWQLVEDGMLSQCGSSPRSLSVKDLDSLEPESAPASSEGEEEICDPDSHEGSVAVLAALDRADIPTSSHAETLAGSDSEERAPAAADAALQSDAVQEGQEEVGSEHSTESDSELGSEGLKGQSNRPEANLSGGSSYADVSMADEPALASDTVHQGLVDSLSPSVISEMIAAADAASESGLLSDTDEEEAPLPDTGVFSIATGYPLEDLVFRGQSPGVESEGLREMDFGSPGTGSFSGSVSSELSSTAGEGLPQLQPEGEEEANKWRDWLQSSGNTCASKFLHRIWFQLQVVARRAGTCIPFSLRRRVASILRCIDAQVSQRGKGGAYLAYGAAFVGFVLALRYYREVRRLRQLNVAQKEAFDMHVLKVLDLNEKLGRGMNIPITYNCGLKDLSFTKRSYTSRTIGFPNSFLTAVP